MKRLLPLLLVFAGSQIHADDAIRLYPGFVTKIRCTGKLLLSAVGNDAVVRIEALPKELGCGVLLKSLVQNAHTNLVLETTSGSIRKLITVASASATPTLHELEHQENGDPR